MLPAKSLDHQGNTPRNEAIILVFLVLEKLGQREVAFPETSGEFGRLLAGAVVVENIFNWPGMGQLLVHAINMRDYQLVQSILLISALVLIIGNLLADILYTIADPRISFN